MILIPLMLMALIACSNNQKWPEEMDKLSMNEQIEYVLSDKIGKELGLDGPTSIIRVNNNLYVTDTNNDRVVVSDLEGNFIRSIGQTGNGPLEFIKPTGLASDDELNVYVVDSGNNRVQVINANDSLVSQYEIDGFPYIAGLSQLMDIALKDGSIYLTSQTMDRSWAKIIILAKDGSVESYGESLVGHITNMNGLIRFVSVGQFIESKEELSLESGRNYMIDIQEKQLGEIIELPYKYTAGDIQSTQQDIYMLSKAYGTIDRFDHNGKYVSTLYKFKGEVDERRGLAAFTIADKDLYVLNTHLNLIYHLKKEGG